MSSNIRITRVCQHCGNEFTAKTTVTKYCGDRCAKRAYKKRINTKKIEESNTETRAIISKPIEQIQSKEFLSIADTCQLLGVSRWTIWRAIKDKEIKAVQLGKKRIIIKRSEIDRLF